MGFRMERTVYDLPFEGTALEGLKITVRAMTMEQRMRVFFDLGVTKEDSVEVARAKQDERYALFIGHIVSWNIEDENGEPVPVTIEDLFRVAEPEQVGTITGIWSSGRTSVPAPLEPASPATSLSEIPMTVQESTPEPVS